MKKCPYCSGLNITSVETEDQNYCHDCKKGYGKDLEKRREGLLIEREVEKAFQKILLP